MPDHQFAELIDGQSPYKLKYTLTLKGESMRSIGEDIWVVDDSFKLMGCSMGLRMTVVKTSDGSVWVHSPTRINEELKAKVSAIGPVKHLVAASNGHNIWIRDWQDAFSDAKVHIAAGIPKKIKIENFDLLDGDKGNLWTDDFDHAYMPVNFFNEHVFFHKKSKSLIVTDFVQNHSNLVRIGAKEKTLGKLFSVMGFKGECTAPPLKMGFVRKDKVGFEKFAKKVLSWDFDKIVVTHGAIIDTTPKETLTNLCQKFFV
jgi:hypothetical protein